MQISLNNDNCQEMTTEELEAFLLEAKNESIRKFRKELKKIHKAMNIVGWKSEAGREEMKKEIELKTNFKNAYGEKTLIEALIGKASSFAKLSNKKGCGYGNL